MSTRLLEPLPGVEHLQSPVDDLWSFYYVAQWAAAFNCSQFPRDDDIPPKWKKLQDRLDGPLDNRNAASMEHGFITEAKHGRFMFRCEELLAEWYRMMGQLESDYMRRFEELDQKEIEENSYKIYYPLFREFTDRGVLEYLGLVAKHFGAYLAGNVI